MISKKDLPFTFQSKREFTRVLSLLMDLDPLELPCVPLSDKEALPNSSGFYFVTKGATIIYLGKAENLRERWKYNRHHREIDCISLGANQINYFAVDVDPDILEAIEDSLINKYQPTLNYRERTDRLKAKNKSLSESLESLRQENKRLKDESTQNTSVSVDSPDSEDDDDLWETDLLKIAEFLDERRYSEDISTIEELDLCVEATTLVETIKKELSRAREIAEDLQSQEFNDFGYSDFLEAATLVDTVKGSSLKTFPDYYSDTANVSIVEVPTPNKTTHRIALVSDYDIDKAALGLLNDVMTKYPHVTKHLIGVYRSKQLVMLYVNEEIALSPPPEMNYLYHGLCGFVIHYVKWNYDHGGAELYARLISQYRLNALQSITTR